MQAIIMAAGKGSRLGKLTEDNPKCFLEINGVPSLTFSNICLLFLLPFQITFPYKSSTLLTHNSQWGGIISFLDAIRT